jgi:predicted SnoaL-like aldol condensation-catalyzing enzyme
MRHPPIAVQVWAIRMSEQEQNRANAIDFYKTAYLGDPAKAVERFVGEEYIQHNPAVGDGKAAFVEYFERMAAEYPGKTIEFVRSVSEGNFVALHTHQVWPDGDEFVTMDFFRFDESGKIVEHWDSIQEVPRMSANQNSMY